MLQIENNTRISEFFNTKYVTYAGYDTFRKTASYIDGLKVSQRKAIWVALDAGNFKSIKVSQFASDVTRITNYVHGEGSMQSVITNMAKKYVGSNNINLLFPDGSFGSRFDEEPGAPRYIFVAKEPIIDAIFSKADLEIVDKQVFEGSEIEPSFLIPTIPLLLINGASGVGTGFKQQILPRNPKVIIKMIKDMLVNEHKYDGKKIAPWYRGFNGTISLDESGEGWKICGKAKYLNSTTILIEELPIGYNLNEYKKVLDKLVETGKIKDFEDLSDDDIFKFEVKVSRELSGMSENELLIYLKLIKKVSELFVCIDETNRVVEFNNEIEILKAFIKIKLRYMAKRKEHLLNEYRRDLKIIKFKLMFIKAIHESTLNVMVSTKEVVQQLEDAGYERFDGSYSYLLDLKIHTLTEDKYAELKAEFKKIYDAFIQMRDSTCEQLFTQDLDSFSKELK